MKIIDGKGARLGRLASYVAKVALQGEEVVVLNCNDIIITGSRVYQEKKLKEKRSKIGSGQKGPKVSRLPHMLVKRTIRGMLPNHRKGRGKIALKKIKCYSTVPKEFENQKKTTAGKGYSGKHTTIKEISL